MAYLVKLKEFSVLTAGNRADDGQRLFPRHDFFRQRLVRRFIGPIFFEGVEAQERTAFLRDVVTDRAGQHGVLGFERV